MKFPLVEMIAGFWLPPLPSLKLKNVGARCGILTCGLNHLQGCSIDHHLLCASSNGGTVWDPPDFDQYPHDPTHRRNQWRRFSENFGNFVITCLFSTLPKKAVYLHGDEHLKTSRISELAVFILVCQKHSNTWWYIVIPATVPWSVWFRIDARVIGASFL